MPWELGTQYHYGIDVNCMEGGKFRGWFMRLSPGYEFKEFPAPVEAQAEFEANAALIVRAVNANDSLVNALKECLGFIESGYALPVIEAHHDGRHLAKEARGCWERSHAALVLACGETR